MNKIKSDDYSSKLFKLMNEISPDLILIESLIGELAKINTPYKNDFVYLRTLTKMIKINNKADFEYEISLTMKEIDQFGKLLETIIRDEKVSDLYISTGLIDKIVVLIKNISRIIS